MHIRPYSDKDRANVRSICIITANASKSKDSEKSFLLKLYCDYYIEQEPENCFVLADMNDNAVGYVLCSDNLKKYTKAMSPYRVEILELGFFRYIYSWGEMLAHLPAYKKSKAHLHINILPCCQHQGFGTQLINTLTSSLKEKNISSVSLVVSSKNKNAVSFYKKNGFIPFLNFGKGILMTKTF